MMMTLAGILFGSPCCLALVLGCELSKPLDSYMSVLLVLSFSVSMPVSLQSPLGHSRWSGRYSCCRPTKGMPLSLTGRTYGREIDACQRHQNKSKRMEWVKSPWNQETPHRHAKRNVLQPQSEQ